MNKLAINNEIKKRVIKIKFLCPEVIEKNKIKKYKKNNGMGNRFAIALAPGKVKK